VERDGELRRDIALVPVRAFAVGALAGLVGGGFRIAVSLAEEVQERARLLPLPGVVSIALGAAMVAAAVFLVRRFAPEAGGSGVQEIEGALEGVRPVRWRRVLPVKFLGGVLGLGSGLALGREGPTIQMGGALGRLVADLLRLDAAQTHVLLAAGAGAGLAAAFNAPLSGALFVIEEMRPHFRYGVLSVQGVLIACATADAVVRLMLGGNPVLPMPNFAMPTVGALWLFLAFGALVGGLGRLFNALLLAGLDLFAAIPDRARVVAAAVVGGAAGLLLALRPHLVGGGYATIDAAATGAIPEAGLLALVAARLASTVASYATGAPGGIFAPMVALGALLGLWFGHGCHAAWPAAIPEPGVFAIAGMGALFAATVRAPLTGIALAAELTGEFALILPLTVSAVGATLMAHALGGRPIYGVLLERALAREGPRPGG